MGPQKELGQTFQDMEPAKSTDDFNLQHLWWYAWSDLPLILRDAVCMLLCECCDIITYYYVVAYYSALTSCLPAIFVLYF